MNNLYAMLLNGAPDKDEIANWMLVVIRPRTRIIASPGTVGLSVSA